MKTIHRLTPALLLPVLLSSCAAPPVKLYTLGAPSLETKTMPIDASTPVVQVSRISVPSYLDTVDIIVRRGVYLDHSNEGRLASRFSIGATDLITARLVQRYPHLLVTNEPQIQNGKYQLIITITRFDINEDGHATMDANWSIVPANEHMPILRSNGHFTATGPVSTDSETVSLGHALLLQLGDRIQLP